MIECYGANTWLSELRKRYDIKNTLLNDSVEAFTVLLIHGNKNIIVARYDRTRHYGVVICQRKRDTWVEYDRRQPN